MSIRPDQNVILAMAGSRFPEEIPATLEEARELYRDRIGRAMHRREMRDFPGAILDTMMAAFIMAYHDDMDNGLSEMNDEVRYSVSLTSVDDIVIAAMTMAEEMVLADDMDKVARHVRERAFAETGIDGAMAKYIFTVIDDIEDLLDIVDTDDQTRRIEEMSMKIFEFHEELTEQYKDSLTVGRVKDASKIAGEAIKDSKWQKLVGICFADIMAGVCLGEIPVDVMERYDRLESEMVDTANAIIEEVRGALGE